MAAITNYTTLVSNIQEITEDDGAEFLTYIPTAIDLAEERLIRECDFPELEQSDFGSLTQGLPTLPLPTGYKTIQFFNVTLTSGDRKFLIFKPDDYIIDYWPNASTQDEPKYYGLEGTTNNLVIAPTPDSAYSYQLKFTKSPTKLSDSNQTNYFIDNLKDVLFSACLQECAKFLKAWSQVQVFEGEYQRSRAAWNEQAARQRRDDGNTPANPEGGQNTITHTLGSGSTS